MKFLSIKNIITIFMFLCLICFLSSCNNETTEMPDVIYEDLIQYTDLEEKYYKVFLIANNYEEIINLINKEEQTFLLISKPNCPYCQTYTPMIAKYAYENNFNVIYYNADQTKADYYKADYNTKTISVNIENDYYKLANFLFENDSNVSNKGSDKELVKLREVEFGNELPWIYVPRLILVKNGLPKTSCFKTNMQETNEKTYVDFVEQMNKTLKVN